MTLYDTVVNTVVSNSSHTQVVNLVGPNKRVLDVGCSTGYVAGALVENGCTVSGIEYNAEAAARAAPLLEKIVVADLNEVALEDAFAGEPFDSIVFADVLEHLADPVAVLCSAARILTPEGTIVVSLPNVTHGSLRLALLQGRWQYRDTGLLDRTHIHFYSLDGLHELLRQADLVATDIRSIVLDPLGVEVEVDIDGLPEGVVDWVRSQPEAYTYQYVFSARPARSEDADLAVVPVPAVANPQVQHFGDVLERRARVAAREREAVAQSQELRHKVLVARDNAIGLEAAAGRARVEAQRLRRELDEVRRDVRETHRRLKHEVDSMAELKLSRTWRIGRLVLSPATFLLRGRR